MTYAVEVAADSVNPIGIRLTTWICTFPRFILAEVNTHRDLSRNSASSRAIPSHKLIARVIENPFVPAVFFRNQPGMQGREPLDAAGQRECRAAWLDARDAAVKAARILAGQECHKQHANRLLEPFLWHTAIISATRVENFFNQRVHPDAQPEFDTLARLMREAQEASTPVRRGAGDWHLPLCEDRADLVHAGINPVRVSVGRCARVSYLTHDGRRDPREDIRLAESLLKNGHMSPWEHAARALPGKTRSGNFHGFKQARKMIKGEDVFHPTVSP